MGQLIPLLALAALIGYVGVVALVRWRTGKRPLVTGEDYGCGCFVVVVLGAVVSFSVALWWWDKPWWVALLIGLGVAAIAGLQLGEVAGAAHEGDSKKPERT